MRVLPKVSIDDETKNIPDGVTRNEKRKTTHPVIYLILEIDKNGYFLSRV
ncbi:hypothetical protein ACN4EG_14180 [Alkalinema pantanalense CENA528]